ncbi:hypothetical protein QE95_003944 [Salmonella enterica subsp. salamae]|nr:hypothetical protein [Salmonella enterica subsp. salamae]
MINNKLTDGRSRLREAAKNYQTALAWYQSNIDSPAALQAWDIATAEFMSAIGNRETDIIADLLNEIDALTKHAEILVAGIDSPVAYLYQKRAEMENIFGTGESWEINDRFFESDLPVVEIPESDGCEFMPLYASPQPLNAAERAELQERRKAEAPAPVMVAECAICGKSCTNANHPVKAVTIESPLNTSGRAELHAFRRAACNHGFPPGAHTQGVIGCVKCSGRLVMMWEQPNGGDCES